MKRPAERETVISGIGMSAVGRRLMRGDLDLTIEACLRAVADAGLTLSDIDGLSTFPGAAARFLQPGLAGPSTAAVQDALRLELQWHSGGMEGAAQLQAVVNACMAVAAGLAKHVLVYRTVTESTAQSAGRLSLGVGLSRADDFLEWLLPFGAVSAVNWLAVAAQRHMYTYGTTREQLAQIPLTARANAIGNPQAVYTQALTMSDYLNARMVSTPFCLYDCDVPVDGSVAFVVSHVDIAADLPNPAVHVNAVGTALAGRPSWDQRADLTTMAAHDAAAMLWNRTDLTPADIDVAELYDGFSFLTLAWIEALGFCPVGEGGNFVEGGTRIGLAGQLPINTNGGQLSAGRLHGFGFIHEACAQLRGTAAGRQVPGDAEVAVVSNGGGPIGGAMLLTRGVG